MKKIYITLIISALLLILFFAYDKISYLNVTVKFDDLEPFDKQIPVYFKGFKIGKTVKIYPDKDYVYSFVDIKISPRNVRFPSNIEARFENGASGDYISLVAPERACVVTLKDGDIINGGINPDLSRIITDTLGSGNVTALIEGASNVLVTADGTFKELTELFDTVNSVIYDLKVDLNKTASDLSETGKNLSEITSKINSATDLRAVRRSVQNIDETAYNIKEMSKNLETASETLNNTTMPSINDILCNTGKTMQNTSEITGEIKQSVSERKGVIGFLFGKKRG